MTPEQLAAARASYWRQNAEPMLTLEDATEWMERMQLALFLPRKSLVLAPAPSFVEAVMGEGSATPTPEAIAQASALLARLVMEGTVVPLNLFGTAGEQPDFLAATGALPYLAALQADRNWKKAPPRVGAGKVSPLAIEIWKLLDRGGALTVSEIREQLGHELTEAATIRGLSELWQNLRVAPLPQGGGEAAHWQILSVTHKKEMAAGGTMAQSAALSMLVSNYLQAVLTATAEDVEAFLSPVASRSRLRDVVRGLTAARQLRSLSMDAQTFLFIDGTLPEMPDVAPAEGSGDESAKPAFMGRSAYRARMLNKGKDEEEALRSPGRERSDGGARPPRSTDRPSAPRRFAAGGSGGSSFRKRATESGGFRAGAGSGPGSGPRRSFGAPGSMSGAGGAARRDRPTSGDRERSGRPARPPFRSREEGSGKDARGERPSFRGARPASSSGERPFRPRPSGPRPDGERPAFRRSAGDSPAGGGKGFSKAAVDRPASSSRPFRPRQGTTARDGRTFAPPSRGGKDGSRPSFRERPAAGPSAEKGRTFRPRTENRSEGGRPGADGGRPFRPREGGRPEEANRSRAGFQSRTGGRPGRPAGDRPRPDRGAGDRPSSGRPRPPRAEGDRPFAPRRREGAGEGRPPRKFEGKPSYPKREGADRPRRTEGGSREGAGARPSGRPASRGFVRGEGRSGAPSSGGKSGFRPRPGGGAGGRPSTRPPSTRPSSTRPGAPGRNPGGTGRPGGRPGSGRAGGPGRPGGLRPPVRKPRPETEGE